MADLKVPGGYNNPLIQRIRRWIADSNFEIEYNGTDYEYWYQIEDYILTDNIVIATCGSSYKYVPVIPSVVAGAVNNSQNFIAAYSTNFSIIDTSQYDSVWMWVNQKTSEYTRTNNPTTSVYLGAKVSTGITENAVTYSNGKFYYDQPTEDKSFAIGNNTQYSNFIQGISSDSDILTSACKYYMGSTAVQNDKTYKVYGKVGNTVSTISDTNIQPFLKLYVKLKYKDGTVDTEFRELYFPILAPLSASYAQSNNGSSISRNVWKNFSFDNFDIESFEYFWGGHGTGGKVRIMVVPHDSFSLYMNMVGVPWTLSDTEAATGDIEKFTDYNPNPYIPPTGGQPNNTTSDWTGAGDNSEDSLEIDSPTFNPNSSVVNQYIMSTGMVNDFKREIYRVDLTNIDRWNNDPKEGVLSCRFYPFNLHLHDLEHNSEYENVVVGKVQLLTKGFKVENGYNQILDLGEFDIQEYFGGFLDYQLTTIDIYLPFIGWQQVKATSVMNRKLKFKYIVDIMTGDCTCLLMSSDSTTERLEGIYNGRMGIDIPIIFSNHQENAKNAASTILSTAVTVGGAVATFATGGAAAPVAIGASVGAITNSATNIATMQNHVNLGTPISATSSLWLPQDIIIRITRPTKSEASEFKNRRGYRSNYSTQLKNVTGFVQIDDPFLDGLSLHEGEKEQLAQLLKGGIFI